MPQLQSCTLPLLLKAPRFLATLPSSNVLNIAVLLEAIEAMRLRYEAKRGATMRPASQATRAGSARRVPECASCAPPARSKAIAFMHLLFVGRVGLQPANLARKPGPLKLDKK